MKISRAIAISLLLIFIVPVLLSACGSGSAEVPDALIQELVNSNDYADWGQCDWTVIHNYDTESHRDNVKITLTVHAKYATVTSECSAVYEYDKASDLWTLLGREDWTDPVYIFSASELLETTWTFEDETELYEVTITNVTPTQITLEYYIRESIFYGFSDWYTLEVSGSGTFDIKNDRIRIPFDLPDGLYVSWQDTASGENESVAYLRITLSPEDGVESVRTTPEIHVYSN